MFYNKLTKEESEIIVNRGTEAPFSSGDYENNFADGVYVCRRCNAPLYDSRDRFESDCGWPSFDDELPGAVTRRIDYDGERTEIACAKCGAHLGHLYIGEDFTPKNVRHSVNSLSIRFLP